MPETIHLQLLLATFAGWAGWVGREQSRVIDPENPVAVGQMRRSPISLEDIELMAKGEVLQGQ